MENTQPTDHGPIEALLRQSTTATHRAVKAIRSAEVAKANLREDINTLTTSFDKAIQKSLALIDRLDESVYSGRIDNAKKRAKIEKEAQELIEKAYSNPAESGDLRLFERTVDVLRDSAIGLHREYFNYDETVDASDILSQVLEYTYRTNALQKSITEKEQKMKQRKMATLEDILNEILDSLVGFQESDPATKSVVSNIGKIVDEMKDKLAKGVYGQASRSNSLTQPETHGAVPTTTTSGYVK